MSCEMGHRLYVMFIFLYVIVGIVTAYFLILEEG